MNAEHLSALPYLTERARQFRGQATIVGKGPSFSDYDPDGRHAGRFVVGLNETAMRTRCHASFVIDEDILEKDAESIAGSGVDVLITPRLPHRKSIAVGGLALYGPSGRLAVQAPWHPTFGARHRCFNLSTGTPDEALGPTFQAFNFSAPTVSALLAEAGFSDILLVGVDGGKDYSTAFKDVEYKKLRSIQNSFDAQFAELRGIRDQRGVVFRSARCNEAFVLIGTEQEQILATEVLKWSIEARTFLTIRYCESESPARAMYVTGQAGTPFSFQRLYLPKMAGHVGRGLYFDSDMLVFDDVYHLYNRDMGDKVLLGCEPTPGRRRQYSVFLVDNIRADWDPDRLVEDYRTGRVTYDALMKEFCFAQLKASTLPMAWNSLELFEPGRTANIHFTDMGTQPWLSIYNPNAELWCEALFMALADRTAVRDAFEQSLARGWVRPSLRWQVEQRCSDPWSLPSHVKAMDREWLPPHVRQRTSDDERRVQLLKWRIASRIRRAMQSRSYVRLMRAGQALRKVF